MKPLVTTLPDRRVWLRVAARDWVNPLDSSWAARQGGRWNPPHAFATLYLNADVQTAQLQIERLCEGMPFSPEDISDDAYRLVLLRLPTSQRAADAVSSSGLAAMGLPASYPKRSDGKIVEHQICQTLGAQVHALRLNGVWCRSAASVDGRGRELAWFPESRAARLLRDSPLNFGHWRYASSWRDIGLTEQPDPK